MDRAFELVMAEPRGPVYLTLPREVLARRSASSTISSPARRQVAGRRFPDPARIEEAAERPRRRPQPADRHRRAGARAGRRWPGWSRSPKPAASAWSRWSPAYVNFPADHPLPRRLRPSGSQDTRGSAEADVVLVVDADVPWFPSRSRPADGAAVIHLAVDPFYSRYPMRCYPVRRPDRRRAGGGAAAPRRGGPAPRRPRRGGGAPARGRRGAPGAPRALGRRPPTRGARPHADRLRVGVAVRRRGARRRHDGRQRVPARPPPRPAVGPRGCFGSPHSGGLGWGLGAALGAKLAAPEKTVIATVGDGAYIFGAGGRPPGGAPHGLPVLTVIFNKPAWEAVSAPRARVHPDGWAATTAALPPDRALRRRLTTRRSCGASTATASASRIRPSCRERSAAPCGPSATRAARPS